MSGAHSSVYFEEMPIIWCKCMLCKCLMYVYAMTFSCMMQKKLLQRIKLCGEGIAVLISEDSVGINPSDACHELPKINWLDTCWSCWGTSIQSTLFEEALLLILRWGWTFSGWLVGIRVVGRTLVGEQMDAIGAFPFSLLGIVSILTLLGILRSWSR